MQGWPSESQAQTVTPAAQPSLPAPKWIGQLNSCQDDLDVREVLSRNRVAAQQQGVGDERSAPGQQQGDTTKEQKAAESPRKSQAYFERSRSWQRRRQQQDALSSEDLAYANILPAPRQKGNAAKVWCAVQLT